MDKAPPPIPQRPQADYYDGVPSLLARKQGLPPSTSLDEDVERGEMLLTLRQATYLSFMPRPQQGKRISKRAVNTWTHDELFPLEYMWFNGVKHTTSSAIKRRWWAQDKAYRTDRSLVRLKGQEAHQFRLRAKRQAPLRA